MKKLLGFLVILPVLCLTTPMVSVAQPTQVKAASAAAVQEKIDVNAASVKELQNLPGIGRVTAQRIIDYRTANGPFAATEDLLKVKGIGKSTLEKISDRIVL